MYHWIKQKLYYAKNVGAPSSNKESISAKPQDFLQEQVKKPISQSQSLPAKNVDMSTLSSYQKRLRILAKNTYSGIQGEIYD